MCGCRVDVIGEWSTCDAAERCRAYLGTTVSDGHCVVCVQWYQGGGCVSAVEVGMFASVALSELVKSVECGEWDIPGGGCCWLAVDEMVLAGCVLDLYVCVSEGDYVTCVGDGVCADEWCGAVVWGEE